MACPKCGSEKITLLNSGRKVCGECKFTFGDKKQAREGTPEAISLLLNQTLNPKKITASVSLDKRCLEIILDSKPEPNKDRVVAYIKSVIKDQLKPLSIEKVVILGWFTGKDSFAWKKEFIVDDRYNLQSVTVGETTPVDSQPSPDSYSLAPRPLQDDDPTLSESALMRREILALNDQIAELNSLVRRLSQTLSTIDENFRNRIYNAILLSHFTLFVLGLVLSIFISLITR